MQYVYISNIYLKKYKLENSIYQNFWFKRVGGIYTKSLAQIETLVLFKNQFAVSPLMIGQPNPEMDKEY